MEPLLDILMLKNFNFLALLSFITQCVVLFVIVLRFEVY